MYLCIQKISALTLISILEFFYQYFFLHFMYLFVNICVGEDVVGFLVKVKRTSPWPRAAGPFALRTSRRTKRQDWTGKGPIPGLAPQVPPLYGRQVGQKGRTGKGPIPGLAPQVPPLYGRQGGQKGRTGQEKDQSLASRRRSLRSTDVKEDKKVGQDRKRTNPWPRTAGPSALRTSRRTQSQDRTLKRTGQKKDQSLASRRKFSPLYGRQGGQKSRKGPCKGQSIKMSRLAGPSALCSRKTNKQVRPGTLIPWPDVKKDKILD